MAEESQNQRLEQVDLNNSTLKQTQAGRDAFVDSQVTINKSFISLFGDRTPSPGVNWDWAMRLLNEKMLPEIKSRLEAVPFEGTLSGVGLTEKEMY